MECVQSIHFVADQSAQYGVYEIPTRMHSSDWIHVESRPILSAHFTLSSHNVNNTGNLYSNSVYP